MVSAFAKDVLQMRRVFSFYISKVYVMIGNISFKYWCD